MQAVADNLQAAANGLLALRPAGWFTMCGMRLMMSYPCDVQGGLQCADSGRWGDPPAMCREVCNVQAVADDA